MELRNADLPAVIQAFELQDNDEIFIAEQVVNSQSEIETFTTKYTGKLIKAKKVPVLADTGGYSTRTYKKQPSSAGIILIVIIIIIALLVIYGFSTGWIQEKLHLKI